MSVITFERARPYVVTEATDPSAADSGYKVGTLWLNTTSYRAFICLSNNAGAAIWKTLGGNFDSFTSAAELTAPACVALNSSGQLIYANAGAASTANVIGFIPVSISTSAVGLVQYAGRFTFTGATFTQIGSFAYLSITDGQVSLTPPAFASGRVVIPICRILSTTDLLISLQPGRSY